MLRIIQCVKRWMELSKQENEYWDEEISYLIKNESAKLRFTNAQKENILNRFIENLSL